MIETLAYYSSALRMDFVEYSKRELQNMGISQGLLYFLLYVGKHPDCSLGELSEMLHADAGHTTRSIDKLVLGGFVERRRLEHNKRMAALRLTSSGDKVFEKAHTLFYDWDARVLHGIGPEEKEILFKILRGLVNTERKDYFV